MLCFVCGLPQDVRGVGRTFGDFLLCMRSTLRLLDVPAPLVSCSIVVTEVRITEILSARLSHHSNLNVTVPGHTPLVTLVTLNSRQFFMPASDQRCDMTTLQHL